MAYNLENHSTETFLFTKQQLRDFRDLVGNIADYLVDEVTNAEMHSFFSDIAGLISELIKKAGPAFAVDALGTLGGELSESQAKSIYSRANDTWETLDDLYQAWTNPKAGTFFKNHTITRVRISVKAATYLNSKTGERVMVFVDNAWMVGAITSSGLELDLQKKKKKVELFLC